MAAPGVDHHGDGMQIVRVLMAQANEMLSGDGSKPGSMPHEGYHKIRPKPPAKWWHHQQRGSRKLHTVQRGRDGGDDQQGFLLRESGNQFFHSAQRQHRVAQPVQFQNGETMKPTRARAHGHPQHGDDETINECPRSPECLAHGLRALLGRPARLLIRPGRNGRMATRGPCLSHTCVATFPGARLATKLTADIRPAPSQACPASSQTMRHAPCPSSWTPPHSPPDFARCRCRLPWAASFRPRRMRSGTGDGQAGRTASIRECIHLDSTDVKNQADAKSRRG